MDTKELKREAARLNRLGAIVDALRGIDTLLVENSKPVERGYDQRVLAMSSDSTSPDGSSCAAEVNIDTETARGLLPVIRDHLVRVLAENGVALSHSEQPS